MPITTAFFLIGSLAISGLPLFNGFVSEIIIYRGLIDLLLAKTLAANISGIVGLGGLAFIGVMAVLCFTKVFGICFLGSPRSNYQHTPQEVKSPMLLPMLFMVILIVLIGLAAPLVLPLLHSLIVQLVPTLPQQTWADMIIFYQELAKALLLFAGLIALFVGLRFLLLRKRSVVEFKTWDCGWQQTNPKMQYTAGSFASPFLILAKVLTPQKAHLEKPQGYFPESASFHSHNQDIFDRFLVGPLVTLVDRALKLFSWIQGGKTQRYILYGLIFLIVLVIWIIGVR